ADFAQIAFADPPPPREDTPSPKRVPPRSSSRMFSPSRRAFLASSLVGLAGAKLFAADTPAGKIVDADKAVDGPTFQPNTLFLTWQRDPTTTMTVQWVGTAGETADTTVSFAPLKDVAPAAGGKKGWPGVAPAAKPYPMTD